MSNVIAFAQQSGSGPTMIVESGNAEGNYLLRLLGELPGASALRFRFSRRGYEFEGWERAGDSSFSFRLRGPRGKIVSRDLRPHIDEIQVQQRREGREPILLAK